MAVTNKQGIDVDVNELMDCASRMAQELQEFVDEAEQGGSELKSVVALIDEWNDLYQATQQGWQNKVDTNGVEEINFD